MGGHPFAEIPCIICSKPVDLTVDLIADENGGPVHEHCYVNRTKASSKRGWGRYYGRITLKETRIVNALTDEDGEDVSLKAGQDVTVTPEANPTDSTKNTTIE
jgi:hypothetical protein